MEIQDGHLDYQVNIALVICIPEKQRTLSVLGHKIKIGVLK